MPQKTEYEPPGVGTTYPLRSNYVEDMTVNLIKNITSVLEKRGMIRSRITLPFLAKRMIIKINEFADKMPVRNHERCWIDGGEKIAVIHPETKLPFFFNVSGSIVCRLCDESHNVGDIINKLKKVWSSTTDKTLIKDVVSFLILLEELDLIDFKVE
jgi:hypothetical protein